MKHILDELKEAKQNDTVRDYFGNNENGEGNPPEIDNEQSLLDTLERILGHDDSLDNGHRDDLLLPDGEPVRIKEEDADDRPLVLEEPAGNFGEAQAEEVLLE